MDVTVETATALVRQAIDPGLTVRASRPLHGGMVNTVVEWQTDGDPPAIVVKLSPNPDEPGFRAELETMQWYRAHTKFPVPEPYACVSDCDDFQGSCLMMERIAGRNMARATISAEGARRLQVEMAHHVARLHDHRRDTYGSAARPDEGRSTWLEDFAKQIASWFNAIQDQLSDPARATIGRLLDDLPEWLPEMSQPTLAHGDLWAANIMVDDADPDRPRITGFVDGHASFAEVECELAYLRVFNTADATFFDEYQKRHTLRPGFDRRCRVYWLNTMMLHVDYFGAQYLAACERLAREIEQLR